MSLANTISITCPQCGVDQPARVWSSLNVQVDPEGKDDLYDGRINTFECDSCDYRAPIQAPFMYHDMSLGFCVQYYPPELMEDKEILSAYGPDGTSRVELFGLFKPPQDVLDRAGYMLRPHIVFSMPELVLYVLFRDKLASYHEQHHELEG